MVQNSIHSIANMFTERFKDTVRVEAWGETSFFYNPNNRLPRGVYFATLKSKDGENDSASALNRDGIFRLNIGTSKTLFVERFGPPPRRPEKGKTIGGDWDFTTIDHLTPHPVYGWMSWVSILNPGPRSLVELDPMLQAGFDKAVIAYEKRVSKL